MPLYEHVFLARQDASPQQVEELTTQMTGIVEQAGGKVTKTENWGVRSLTYRMNKNRKAHFVLLNIDAPSAAIAEIERQERINEDVIRYLSVRVEDPGELEEAVKDVLAHDGPALLDVVTNTQELAMPPSINLEQVKGFGLWAIQAVISGRGTDLIDVAKTNLLR